MMWMKQVKLVKISKSNMEYLFCQRNFSFTSSFKCAICVLQKERERKGESVNFKDIHRGMDCSTQPSKYANLQEMYLFIHTLKYLRERQGDIPKFIIYHWKNTSIKGIIKFTRIGQS